MTIDRLNGIDPVKPVQPIQRTQRTEVLNKADAVSVSSEARVLSDANIALEAVRNAPDIREDKVAEVKKKFEDPSYINNALLELVADRILDDYGL
ncbi:flagellar biosynthesis anti-sigma factor FlgM [Treponema vincentii]|uniref:flagellar biosynthesis anti-sigma factor FlgM n=1 Tax=Treponema vincentii TaxID=69710 RepID=UPI0020A4CDE7|nr:flagellar biosynthesis anti-sigma factor FlgM [Treponema vincentii]UTC47666.1 flagellar biosynthesis anti-sigma factor FlgM [Treponema vincentii]